MNTKDLLKIRPEALAKEQEDALRAAVVERLHEIQLLIQKKEYEKASTMLESSPSGDGYGCDNDYIDFSDILEPCGQNGTDIGSVLGKLASLKKINKGK